MCTINPTCTSFVVQQNPWWGFYFLLKYCVKPRFQLFNKCTDFEEIILEWCFSTLRLEDVEDKHSWIVCLMNAAYSLSPFQHWWKEMFNQRFGKCGTLLQENLHSLGHPLGINQFFKWHAAPPPPSDSTVKEVADRLANFVAKHGRSIEHITRQKNPGDTPFKYVPFRMSIFITCYSSLKLSDINPACPFLLHLICFCVMVVGR